MRKNNEAKLTNEHQPHPSPFLIWTLYQEILDPVLHQKQMLKIIGKKIFTILRSNCLLTFAQF